VNVYYSAGESTRRRSRPINQGYTHQPSDTVVCALAMAAHWLVQRRFHAPLASSERRVRAFIAVKRTNERRTLPISLSAHPVSPFPVLVAALIVVQMVEPLSCRKINRANASSSSSSSPFRLTGKNGGNNKGEGKRQVKRELLLGDRLSVSTTCNSRAKGATSPASAQ